MERTEKGKKLKNRTLKSKILSNFFEIFKAENETCSS
jgi:hypothetical protein